MFILELYDSQKFYKVFEYWWVLTVSKVHGLFHNITRDFNLWRVTIYPMIKVMFLTLLFILTLRVSAI